MRRTIPLESIPLSDAEADALVGQRLDDRHFEEVIGGGDVDVFDKGGEPLLMLRCRALKVANCRPALRRAAKPSMNRGGIRSGIVGFFDRGRSWDYCRLTPFTRDDFEGWRDVHRLLREMDGVYKRDLPDVYAVQRRFVAKTHPDFVIPRTAFTTATVNNTVSFPAHRDEGNLHLGFSVMAVLRQGDYGGGLFVLPEYRLAVDMKDRDVVLFRAGALHANTPFVGTAGAYERLSVVAYYRAGMILCGSAAEEYARANRVV